MLSGGVVGLWLGLIGSGRSILAAPLLLYVVGLSDAHVAIGTSALSVAANAFANLISHWRAPCETSGWESAPIRRLQRPACPCANPPVTFRRSFRPI